MARPQIAPLRPLTEEERAVLTQISRSASDPASHVPRAKALLAVAEGKTFTDAAKPPTRSGAGRRAGDAVAQLVARFNREGLAAVAPRQAPDQIGGLPRSTVRMSASGFCAKPGARRSASETARPAGR